MDTSRKRKRNADTDQSNKSCWADFVSSKKETNEYETKFKKAKKEILKFNPNARKWVSATEIKSYMLDDPATDWLAKYGQTIGISCSKNIAPRQRNRQRGSLVNNTDDLLYENGHISEQILYDQLKKDHKDKFVVVCNTNEVHQCLKDKTFAGFIRKKYNETIEYMNKGTFIICQAVMLNDTNLTFGFADILVRSDYLSTLCIKHENDEDAYIKAPSLKMVGNNTYHYRVIDYKWTTMTLCVDGKTIRNEGMFPAYKGQLVIYTSCLKQMQGYSPRYAYIMAKAWQIGASKVLPEEAHLYSGRSCFDRLGIVYFDGKDKQYLDETKKAILWKRRVTVEGYKWRYGKTKPTVPEMYPNMNNSKVDSNINKLRNQIAEQYGELTMIWNIKKSHRENAHKKRITSFRDPRCTTKVLGINPDSSTGRTIDAILRVNHSNAKEIIMPAIITDNTQNWQEEKNHDYYIDFETIQPTIFKTPDEYDIDDCYKGNDITFMIGVGFKHNSAIIKTNEIFEAMNINKSLYDYLWVQNKQTKWEYVCIYMCKFDEMNEPELFKLFYEFMYVRNKWISDTDIFRLFHWAPAERRFMGYAKERMQGLPSNNASKSDLLAASMNFDNNATWIDMCEFFKTNPITISGAYKFQLKQVARAFYKQGFISTNWSDDGPSDGRIAMLDAIKIYKTGNVNDIKFKKIIDYNQIDCKVVWEIVNYLRAHHLE